MNKRIAWPLSGLLAVWLASIAWASSPVSIPVTPKATVARAGKARLSVAPASAADPVALGANDPSVATTSLLSTTLSTYTTGSGTAGGIVSWHSTRGLTEAGAAQEATTAARGLMSAADKTTLGTRGTMRDVVTTASVLISEATTVEFAGTGVAVTEPTTGHVVVTFSAASGGVAGSGTAGSAVRWNTTSSLTETTALTLTEVKVVGDTLTLSRNGAGYIYINSSASYGAYLGYPTPFAEVYADNVHVYGITAPNPWNYITLYNDIIPDVWSAPISIGDGLYPVDDGFFTRINAATPVTTATISTLLRDPLTISSTQVAVSTPGYAVIAEFAAGVTQTGASFLFNTPANATYSTPDTTAVIYLALASTDDTTDTTAIITISGKQMAPGIQHDAAQDFDGLTDPAYTQVVALHSRDITRITTAWPGFGTNAEYLALSVSRLGADPADVCTVPIRLISAQMGFAVTHGQ